MEEWGLSRTRRRRPRGGPAGRLVAAPFALAAFVAVLFIHEVPLRTTIERDDESKRETAAATDEDDGWEPVDRGEDGEDDPDDEDDADPDLDDDELDDLPDDDDDDDERDDELN